MASLSRFAWCENKQKKSQNGITFQSVTVHSLYNNRTEIPKFKGDAEFLISAVPWVELQSHCWHFRLVRVPELHFHELHLSRKYGD